MKMYDMDVFESVVDNETVITLDQSLVDHESGNFDTAMVFMSPEQAVIIARHINDLARGIIAKRVK